MTKGNYFLPYQVRWLKDKSKIKIVEKSRRIGLTYVQSYEDVEDCIAERVPAVWFSSADLTAAREYIEYCKKWAKLFNVIAEDLGEVLIDAKKDIKAFAIQFKNGSRINALSSNPSQFRSKGGKVVLDEFAFHDDQTAMWTAARPCITWGYPLRILSTHNGKNCKYFKFIDDVKKGRLKWSIHTITIQTAVEEGLADKITGRTLTTQERQQWLEDERKNCGDEFTWLQEYCCIPVDEATAFLTYELIESCCLDNILKPVSAIEGDMYVGMDIGRKKDLSVITVLEKLGIVKYTRRIEILEKMPFKIQEQVLYAILEHKRFRRACIDATGLGMQFAENAQNHFGKSRVEAVTFNSKIKEDLAFGLLTNFQDKGIRIPFNEKLREDLHSVKKLTTSSGNIRFDVEKSDTDGHADRFWSLALANHASDDNNSGPIHIRTSKKRESYSLIKGFY